MKVEKAGRYIVFRNKEGEEARYDLGERKLEAKRGFFKEEGIRGIIEGVEDEVYGRLFLTVDNILNSRADCMLLRIGEEAFKTEKEKWLTKWERNRKSREVSIKKFFEGVSDHQELEKYYKLNYAINLYYYKPNKERLKERGLFSSKLTKLLIESADYLIECISRLSKREQEVLQELVGVQFMNVRICNIREMLISQGLQINLTKEQESAVYTELKRLKEEENKTGLFVLLDGLTLQSNEFKGLLEELNWNVKKYTERAIYYMDIEGIEIDDLYTIWTDTIRMYRILNIKVSKYTKYLESMHDKAVVKVNRIKVEYDEKLYNEIYKREGEVYRYKGEGFEVRMLPTAQSVKEEGIALNHCVGTYVERVLKGVLVIVALREDWGKPQLTMEIRKEGRIVQVRGKHNRKATLEEQRYIKEYAKAKNLKLEY